MAARAARWILSGRCPNLSRIYTGTRLSLNTAPEAPRNVELMLFKPWNRVIFAQSSRFYMSEADTDDDLVPFEKQHGQQSRGLRNSFEVLWNNVSEGSNIVTAVQEWEREGNSFTRDTLARTLQRLRCRRIYIKAMDILSWTIETKPFELIPGDFAQLINFCCRAKKFKEAEKALQAVPSHLDESPAFAALVSGYASWDMVKKVELLMRSTRAPLPHAYSAQILMYIRTGMYKYIPKVYKGMKAAGREPNVITYAVLLKYKDRIGEIEGLENDIETALSKVKLETLCQAKRTSVAGNMMHVYAMLGKVDKVEDVWKCMDQERFLPEGFYIMAVESLALLGEVRKAEKVAEMKPSSSVYARLFQALAKHYAKQGNMKRAEEMLAKFEKMELTPSFGIYNHLVTGYLARSDPDTAASRLRLAFKVVTEPRAVPSYAAVTGVLPVLAQQKDVKAAEETVRRYRGWTDAKFYKELSNVYTAANEGPSQDVIKVLNKRIRYEQPDPESRRYMLQILRLGEKKASNSKGSEAEASVNKA